MVLFDNNHLACLPLQRGKRGVRVGLELEIVLCVVVADVFDHLLNAGFLVAGVRDHAVLDVVAEDVTERTTEVLMTRIREE